MLEWSERISTEYRDPALYFAEAQVAALIRKYPFSSDEVPGIDPEGTALKKFLSAEHRCKWVNRRRRGYRKRYDPYASYWEHMRHYISRVIGQKPNLPLIYSLCNFTGGASVGVHGNATNVARKFLAKRWTVTPTALKYVTPSLWANAQARDVILPGDIKCYDYELFELIVKERCDTLRYNKITFVPKSAKTHRSIAVEPLLNGWIQKGADEYLRLLLRGVGINLSDQSRNSELARVGSLGGFNPYVTLDLSAASDSMSLEVVKDLLPPAWFEFLEDIRSPSYLLPGASACTRYEKFCSMGNGFCFPLETLLFAAASYAVSAVSSLTHANDFVVYGDDIIVRQSSALLLKELLSQMGFRLNNDKSFIVGTFRESCGADWIAGQDVRPVQMDKRLVDVRQAMSLHNSTYRSERTEIFLEEVRRTLRAHTSQPLMRPGREPGDTCYSVPLDLAVKSKLVKFDPEVQSWSWLELTPKPLKDRGLPDVEAKQYAFWYAFMQGGDSEQLAVLRYSVKLRYQRVCRPYGDKYHGGEKAFHRNKKSSPGTTGRRIGYVVPLTRGH